MNKVKKGFRNTFNFFENNFIFICIRNGLLVLLPFIIVGSFSLVITQFPNTHYQSWIKDFLNGSIYDFFNSIYSVIFNYYALLLATTIAFFYVKHKTKNIINIIGITLLALITTMIIGYTEFFDPVSKTTYYGGYNTSKILISLISGTFVPFIALLLIDSKLFKFKNYTRSSSIFQDSMNLIFPFLIIIGGASTVALLNNHLFPEINTLFEKAYKRMGVNVGTTILLEFVTHIVWFLGIHGNNLFQGVFENIYVLGAHKIFSKSFLDVFVLIGGSGLGLSLLLSILIFSKQKNLKNIAIQGAVPGVFNINEILIFGIPIVLNPILLIPFVLVPIAAFISTYLFTVTGFLPEVTKEVTWTCPIFFSGYIATGSIRGIIVQAFNLALGIVIYLPFVKIYDKYYEMSYENKIYTIYTDYLIAKKDNPLVTLNDFNYKYSGVSKSIAHSLREAIKSHNIKVHYQPLFNKDKEVMGYEALLRFKEFGNKFLNPELLIEISREEGFIYELHMEILDEIFRNAIDYKLSKKISFNIDTIVFSNPSFKDDLLNKIQSFNLSPSKFMIEITEHTAITFNEAAMNDINDLKKAGFRFAIDDFAAGATSLNYIQSGIFTTVKIDGSLTKQITSNPHSIEIIKSIKYLSKSSNFSVLCEYVETEEIFELLKTIDIDFYQGWFFSPAVTPEILVVAFEKENKD